MSCVHVSVCVCVCSVCVQLVLITQVSTRALLAADIKIIVMTEFGTLFVYEHWLSTAQSTTLRARLDEKMKIIERDQQSKKRLFDITSSAKASTTGAAGSSSSSKKSKREEALIEGTAEMFR